jgi:selenium metabolism protein YedF
LTNNLTSYNNLIRFLKDNKAEVKSQKLDDRWELTVTRKGEGNEMANPEEYCAPAISHFEKGDFIVVISSDTMGDGDIALGSLLICNFIKALKDLDTLPGKIIFYNNGVKLAKKDSPVVDHLRQLEKMGVEIILCSTCVNHYGLAEHTGAGIQSDMFTIVQKMADASKILRP